MSRLRILILSSALLALVTAFAACGGGGSDDPQQVIDEATLQGVESGDIDMSLAIDVEGEKGGHVDVSLNGPFQAESEEELPELDLTVEAKGGLGDEKVDFEGGIVLLGNKAYVNYEGTEYEVDPTTFNFVRSLLRRQSGGRDSSSEVTACRDAAEAIQLDDFVDDLSETSGAEVGGTSTTKVRGEVDAAGAIDGLIALTEDPACNEQLGAAGPLPSTAELEQAKGTVQDSVKSAQVDLYVGEDHIVRRIAAEVTIEPPKGSNNINAEKVEIDLDLTLTGVNEDQTISAPQGSKPLSELFLELGINPIELLGLLQGQGGLGGPGGLNDLLEGFGAAGSSQ